MKYVVYDIEEERIISCKFDNKREAENFIVTMKEGFKYKDSKLEIRIVK